MRTNIRKPQPSKTYATQDGAEFAAKLVLSGLTGEGRAQVFIVPVGERFAPIFHLAEGAEIHAMSIATKGFYAFN